MSDSLEHEIRTLRAHFWSDRDPDGRAFAPLAEAYRARGDLEEALALVEDGLGRLPDYATGFLVATRVYRARGDGASARHAVETLLALDGASAPGLRLLGEMAEEAGETETALSAFREALARDPGYADLEGRIARLARPEPSPPPATPPEGAPEGAQDAAPEGAQAPEEAKDAAPEEAQDAAREGTGSEVEGFESFEPFRLPAEEAVAEEGPPDPSEEEEPPDPSEEEGPAPSPPLVTRTMADLYLRQGFRDRGVELYRQLAELHPEDPELRSRLTELEAEPVGEDLGAEPASSVSSPGGEAAAPAVPQGDERSGVPVPSEGGDEPSERAPQWSAHPRSDDPEASDTPFAWIPHEHDDEPRPEPPGGVGDAGRSTARQYLRDLLAWEPGAVPIASLAPEAALGSPGEETAGSFRISASEEE